ncbi:LolA-like protein [Actinoalloteichus hymeniacidonis]|uniref:LppX_LprAFG lipoprotein n=1 Tax=Actinoalloteichus hymeniacidonis TaxID=340345 RepID=A0AAC9HU83_9PSEU|nr:hypothetical protein [Actinoalloteichus hymeniacidonis]AOS65424.1 hypothetical protein TL08_23220 [Actinoalloteichus hymeniacidonis]MBB5906489.1 hypothetical protein [Actinoalloteichus hymeniacidonis]
MRRTTIAAITLGLVTVAGACGGDGSDYTPEGPDTNMGTGGAEQTEETGSESGAPESSTAPGEVSPQQLFSSMNDSARQKGSAHFTISSSEEGFGSGDGQIRYTDDGADISLTVELAIGEAEEHQQISLAAIDKVVYLNLGDVTPGDKPWVRIDPSQEQEGEVNQAFAMVAQQLVDAADPTSQLNEQAEAAEITDTGDEDLDGVETTRYDLHLDIAKMAQTTQHELEKQRLQTAVDNGLESIDYQIWLDKSDNVPVRFVINQPGITGNFDAAVITIDYTGWGESVEIDAPPEDEVGELPAG